MNKLALSIFGQNVEAPEGIPQGHGMLWKIIGLGIEFLLIFAVLLTLLFLVWGGLSMITSTGDKEKYKRAKSKIKYAILGLVVAFGSFFLLNIFGDFFGINLI